MDLKSSAKAVQGSLLLVMISFLPQSAVAQEEQHPHERHVHPQYAALKNPIATTKRSVAEGKKQFEQHCVACHGKGGKGGIGPGLTSAMKIHGSSDGEIFHVITEGVSGTAMKGFKEQLPDKDRWHLVNYIQSIKAKGE